MNFQCMNQVSTYFCTTVRVALVRSRRPVAGRRNNPTAPFPRPVKTPKIPRLRAPEREVVIRTHDTTAVSQISLNSQFCCVPNCAQI